MSIAARRLARPGHAFLTAFLVMALHWCVAQAAEPVSLVLVAHPGLTDPNFARSVVLVTRTLRDETIGVILNRRLRGGNAPPQLPDDANLREAYFGGPLAPRGWFGIGASGPAPELQQEGAAIDILPGLQLVVGAARVRALVQAGTAGRVKVFAGYAGWAPGQLEQEIANGGWTVLPASEDLVFDADPDSQWERLSAPLRAVRLPPRPGVPVTAPVSERFLGANVFHAVNRAHVDVAHIAALQHLERDRITGAAAGPQFAIERFERLDRFALD